MSTYQYEALDSAGKPTKGSVEAGSSEDAIQQIRGQGYFPTSVRQDDEGGGRKSLLGGRGKSGGKKAAAPLTPSNTPFLAKVRFHCAKW